MEVKRPIHPSRSPEPINRILSSSSYLLIHLKAQSPYLDIEHAVVIIHNASPLQRHWNPILRAQRLYFSEPSHTFDGVTRLSGIQPQGPKCRPYSDYFRGRINTRLNFTEGVLRDYRVIVVALFGGESSSPSNTENFPSTLDYRDCVRAPHRVITETFKLFSTDVIIGFFMGGQCTYH